MDGYLNTVSQSITPEILSLIAEIDEFKGAWQAIGRIAPERFERIRHVATIASVASSTRIEGAKLTNRMTEQLLANIDIKALASRDEQEVAGYADVMKCIFDNWNEISLTENHIKQLHGDLLKYSPKDERHRGQYKTCSNNVEAQGSDEKSIEIVLVTATPFDTPRLMGELVDWARPQLEAKHLHPLLVIAVFIVVFLEIHPFQDGNGRLARILTTLLLLRAGYAYVPYSSLESVIERTKKHYYLGLYQTQRTIRSDAPGWHPWVVYLLNALREQKRRLEKKIEREELILGELSELSVQLLELARDRGRLTVASASKATGSNRNTIKDHLRKLMRNGYLARHGAGRGTWYTLANLQGS